MMSIDKSRAWAEALINGRSQDDYEDSDCDLAMMLEDAIEQRGLQHEYSIILVGIVSESWHLQGWRSWEDSWALIRATPEQRARAFLQAVTP